MASESKKNALLGNTQSPAKAPASANPLASWHIERAHTLLSTASEHGLVLDKPEPEVRFSNFGDNSLVFNLLFWFDSAKTGRDTLASDLRYMIEKALPEAGITIASSQRDVHFDPSTPLRVELTRAQKSDPGSKPG